MSTGFNRGRGGTIRLHLTAQEASVVRVLITQLLELLGGTSEEAEGDDGAGDGLPSIGLSENTSVSDDPALARLFPDAYSDDQDAAAEFRRYTEVGLRDGKREAARLVLGTFGEAGGEIVLDAGQAQAWLRTLNDVRLALGTRLDITEDAVEEMRGLAHDDPRYAAFAAYDWLTYLQESLVHALW